MKNLTKLKIYVVLVSLLFITLVVHYFNLKNELKECKEDYDFIQGGDIEKSQLTNRADSLYDELFIEKVDASRHELTRDEILNKYPKVKKEYEDYYNHQTE
jgi:hypothetical protein